MAARNSLCAEAVLRGFERSLAPGLLVLELEPQDYRHANACLRGWTTTLRAADALHLAIASGRGASLCNLDAPFVAAAQPLGLDAQGLGAGVPQSRSSPRPRGLGRPIAGWADQHRPGLRIGS